MDISTTIQYVIANKGNIIQIILAVIGAASLIVKMTPTLTDDNILKGVIKFIGKFVALDKYGPKA